MKFCASCFNDSVLDDFLSKGIEVPKGVCGYCGSANIELNEPQWLKDKFEDLRDLYEPDEAGESFADLIQDDWLIFSSDLTKAKREQLINEIFEEDYSSLKFRARKVDIEDSVGKWESFKKELKHINRFFPETASHLGQLKELLQILSCSFTQDVLFRSRVNRSLVDFREKDIRQPPSKDSSSGRANPFGISYLYTATSENTAIAEVRAQISDVVAVAKFEPEGSLSLVDLRDPRQKVSPFSFMLSDYDDPIGTIKMLCHLGNELSLPVVNKNAQLEYLATQYLCELIKKEGYAGVMYKSSQSGDGGDNIVLFQPEKVTFKQIKYVKVLPTDLNNEPFELPQAEGT